MKVCPMGSLSASVSSLLSALNIGAPKPIETSGNSGGAVDNFSSLLAIGNDAKAVRDVASEAANTNARNTPQPAQEKPQATKETSKQSPEAREPSSAPKSESHARNDNDDEIAPRAEAPATERKEQPEPAADASAPRPASERAQANAEAPREEAPAQPSANAAEPQSADAAEGKPETNDENVVAAVDELYVLLLSILQTLGITPPTQAPQVTAEGAAPVLPTADIQVEGTEQPQAANPAELLLPTDIAASTLNTDIELPATFLEKLSQIQQAAKLIDDALTSASLPENASALASNAVAADTATPANAPASENAVFGLLQALANKLTARPAPQAEVPVATPETQELTPAPELIKSGSQITSLLHRLAALFQTASRTPQERAPEEQKPASQQLVSALQGTQASPSLSAAGQQIVAQVTATPQAETTDTSAQTEALAALPAVAEPKINPATVAQPTVAAVNNAASVQAIAGRTGGESPQSGGGNSGQNAPGQSSAPAAATAQAQNASSAYKSDFARTLEQTQKNPVIEQVAFHIRTAKATGNSRISIQLNPHELGKVDLRIHISDGGKTHVSITAESKSTLEILQRDAQGLARALNDAGLQTDMGSLSFNLRGGDHGQAGSGQGEGRPHGVQLYQKTQPEDDAEQALSTLSKSYVVNLADGLDIKI
jgi:flagellar hook-length control protein FliK